MCSHSCVTPLLSDSVEGRRPTVMHLCGTFGQNCFISELQNQVYVSEMFHLLSFPLSPASSVVIMERFGVADSHLVQRSLRNISFFSPCYRREVAVPDRRTGPARCSLLTLVRRGHLGQPFSDLQLLPEEGSTKTFQCE